MKHLTSTFRSAIWLAAITFGCGGSDTAPPASGGGAVSVGGETSSGGAFATGGSTSMNPMGGAPATGGVPAATGGAPLPATGGVGPTPTGGVGPVATGGRSPSTGGAGGGNLATGGTPNTATGGVGPTQTGGAAAGGGGGKGATGGAPAGGSATGGKAATGGLAAGGAATGGRAATGGSSATATGGTNVGGGSSPAGPCDIYAAANPATPCVAAYSMTRIIYSKYSGPLYQVRKGGSWSASTGMTGGTFQNIGTVAGGYADSGTQDTFCTGSTCTVSVLYDQSLRGNDLKVAPKGCYTQTASEPDSEGSATKKTININGHKVYALYMIPHDGYRNNTPSGMPTGSAAQGIYEVADGARTASNGTPVGNACCWDFGNASTNNCNQGTMNALYFGTGYWGKGTGSGPWFMADLEGGVWAGGTGQSSVANPNLPSSNVPFAFGILKTNSSNYAIRVGNAASGSLTTAYDGALPKTLNHPGGIILGIGGDNSNSSAGTFFEAAITGGRPSDTTDAAILADVQAAKYGQ
jgi:non-reducing end alpha-L-arabinofuranosidase